MPCLSRVAFFSSVQVMFLVHGGLIWSVIMKNDLMTRPSLLIFSILIKETRKSYQVGDAVECTNMGRLCVMQQTDAL